MAKIDELKKKQLLVLANSIICIESEGNCVPLVHILGYPTTLFGILEETKSLTPLQRINLLVDVVQKIKSEMEIEQAVANSDNRPGEGGSF